MNVKGTAFLARKILLEKELGEPAAKQVLAEVSATIPTFPQVVLASTSIPMPLFLAFQDELVRRCYAGNPLSYFQFGEMSAEWALTVGPYRRLAEDKDLDTFATQGAALFRTYFDVGAAVTSLKNGHVEFRIEGVPAAFRHVYVEYATLGYFKRGMEILGATHVETRRVRGFSNRDDDVLYEIHFQRDKAPSPRRA